MKNNGNNSFRDQILLARVVGCKFFKKHLGPRYIIVWYKNAKKIEVREMVRILSQNICTVSLFWQYMRHPKCLFNILLPKQSEYIICIYIHTHKSSLFLNSTNRTKLNHYTSSHVPCYATKVYNIVYIFIQIFIKSMTFLVLTLKRNPLMIFFYV